MTEKLRKQPVHVITDSVAQVPDQVARELGITVVPFTVTIQGKSFEDGVDLQPDELYRRMRMEKTIPMTSAPSPGKYLEILEKCIDQGARSILCVVLSSNLSGSYNVVGEVVEMMHEDHPKVTIAILDSKSAAIAEGFIAIKAAEAAMEGKDLAEVVKEAQDTQKHVGIVVSFDSLEYLALGGRIGKAAYLLGSMIDIKPIITLDSEGFVDPVGKAFGNHKAYESIIEWVKETTTDCNHLTLAIMDADAPDRAYELKQLAVERLIPDKIFQTTVTPVMGAHTGPGLVGIGYYYE